MTFLKWIPLAILAWVMTLTAYLFAPLICLFIKDGKIVLSWFGTPDAPAIGAEFWKAQNPTYSDYKLSVTWMWRNPAQGFDQLVAAKVNRQTPCKAYGNISARDATGISGWFLITTDGYFHFAYVLPIGFGRCMVGGAGWNLHPIVEGYDAPTLGQLNSTPFRFQKFGT